MQLLNNVKSEDYYCATITQETLYHDAVLFVKHPFAFEQPFCI